MIQIHPVVPTSTGATVHFTLDKPSQVRATYAATWAEFSTPWKLFGIGNGSIDIGPLDPAYKYWTYLTAMNDSGTQFSSRIKDIQASVTPPIPPPPQASLSIKDVTFDSATATISGLSPATKYTVQVAGTSAEFTTPAKQPPILPPNGWGPLFDFMKPLEQQGLLAGNLGDHYVNRDGGHAKYLNPLPQVTVVQPATGLMTGTHAGVAIGNASLADNRIGGSLAYQMQSSYAQQAYNQYRANNLFFYPAHLDMADKTWPDGQTGTDHFRANWPYTMATLGSSSSEIDEVEKFFYTLACFRPDTKRRLVETGMLMPTLQMIYRWTRVGGSEARYLSGEAHPSAFGDCANTQAMCEMAQSMRPDQIPVVANVKVVSDTFTGVERLFDTPSASARKFTDGVTKNIVVGWDASSHTVTYAWRVLRGQATISKLNEVTFRINVNRPTKQLAPGGTIGIQVWSQRVDVGLFVHNGVYWSAPAFVTVWGA